MCLKLLLTCRGTWKKLSKGCYEVRGKTLGIVGYGHIGSQVGVLAEMLGMTVKYFDTASRVSKCRLWNCLDGAHMSGQAVQGHPISQEPAMLACWGSLAR